MYQVGWWLGHSKEERDETCGEFEDLAEAIRFLGNVPRGHRIEDEDGPYGIPAVRVGRIRVREGSGDELQVVISTTLFSEAEIDFAKADKGDDNWVWTTVSVEGVDDAAAKAIEMSQIVERKLRDHATRRP